MWRCLRDPIRLAVSVEHQLVTDRHTHDEGIGYTALAWRRAVKVSREGVAFL